MARGWQGAVLKALRANDHVLTVTGVEQVVPGFRRIRCSSPGIFDDFDPGPTDYLRLWCPDPDKVGREVQRGYTLVDVDRVADTFALDFLLHEPAGPASTWASRAQVGAQITATRYGSRTFRAMDPPPQGYLLVGDAASIPAIDTILAELPSEATIEVVLEFDDPAERSLPLSGNPGVTVHWVERDLTGRSVVDTIGTRDRTGWSVWVGAERKTVKTVKAALPGLGVPKASIKAQAYWMHGSAFGASRPAPTVDRCTPS